MTNPKNVHHMVHILMFEDRSMLTTVSSAPGRPTVTVGEALDSLLSAVIDMCREEEITLDQAQSALVAMWAMP